MFADHIHPIDRRLGDGKQLPSGRFTGESAFQVDDLRPLQNFPAEISAGAETLARFSLFELRFAGYPIGTAGDWPDVLVAPKTTDRYLGCRFAGRTGIGAADVAEFRIGYAFGDTEPFTSRYEVATARLPGRRNRTVDENLALAYRLLIGARSAGVPLFLCADPVMPESGLLHELARPTSHGVRTFQVEDEIAAIAAAVGASFGGRLVVSSTSGRHRPSRC
ncbi:hypothetical protein [Rhodococcus rhodochrous]|uniref:Pyruvate flavodoxin/ferredoxin oxidoreductase pyrimidine binding domain-containing protein n=1 Tax=Rhodococcus rhodochrous KG-21 TaxID=1441923 RepID=A0A0M8PMV4_RHORH|nr:hypothetical protein [Rhodococcus rhodochrous]KOS55419.1 hypothetical protein Z051_15075 [Rhodococcus rhodochrous KG-21]